jgi:arsenate reductase
MNTVRKVLFVSGHNATRGRVAEALLRSLGGPSFEVSSAGFETMEVNPLVVEALGGVGLRVENGAPQPSVFDLFKSGRHFHYVISVCDEAQGEKCPLFPGVAKRLTWNVPDPSTFTGNDAERLERIVDLRDILRGHILRWLTELGHVPISEGTDRSTHDASRAPTNPEKSAE